MNIKDDIVFAANNSAEVEQAVINTIAKYVGWRDVLAKLFYGYEKTNPDIALAIQEILKRKDI